MFDSFYKNIGGKIKGFAKWTFVVEAIAAIISGIVALTTAEDGGIALFGVLLIVLGSIVAYVSSLLLYAFGELVEDKYTMREDIKAIKNEKPLTLKEETSTDNNEFSNTNQSAVKDNKIKSSKTPVTISENKITPPQKSVANEEEPKELLLCPKCGEDLAFMGWNEDDLKEKQVCPLCGKDISFTNK